ncbi:HIT-like protein [Rickettsiales bacterium Ac37b]|nr:HIT-like protein [Rickettsiales bacterium Ac37b]
MHNNTYDNNNVFARIIRGELNTQKIYEDENVLAFNDISPSAPVHILVVPKKIGYISFHDFLEKASSKEISIFFKTIQKIASLKELDKNGYRLVTNIGSDALQEIFHFHVHILAGKSLGPILT